MKLAEREAEIERRKQRIMAIHAEVRAIPPAVKFVPIGFQQEINRLQREIDQLRAGFR